MIDLKKTYELRFKDHTDYRNQVWRILCNDFFSRYISPDATILDLGAGWGEFICNIRAGRKYAMDANTESVHRIGNDARVFLQDCSKPWELESESLDVVFSSNFFEHLTDKPSLESTVREVFRCLRPDGLIICMGPNVKYLAGEYWDFWDHFIPLTELSISELLRVQGFYIDRCTAKFMPYTMSNRRPPLFFLKMYLKMPFLWPFFGRQFLVIGRKPNIID